MCEIIELQKVDLPTPAGPNANTPTLDMLLSVEVEKSCGVRCVFNFQLAFISAEMSVRLPKTLHRAAVAACLLSECVSIYMYVSMYVEAVIATSSVSSQTSSLVPVPLPL